MKFKIKPPKLYVIGLVYWLMVTYIFAGFIWWFVSLERQNRAMYRFRVEELQMDDAYFIDKLEALKDAKNRKSMGYIGEAISFLVVISVGAVFVYRNIKVTLETNAQQQNFMMAVTHELKTPIAVARLNIETMRKRKLNEQQQQHILCKTLDEVERLNVLTNNILVASQLESSNYHLNIQHINISDIAENCIEQFSLRFPNRKIFTDIHQDLYILGEEQLIPLVINNLLDNAKKYTPAEEPLELILFQKQNNIYLELKDLGPGISDEEKKHIFSRFYRVGSESTRNTKGTGLGLFLCQKIIKDLKGTINVRDNQPKGSIFTIILPIAEHRN